MRGSRALVNYTDAKMEHGVSKSLTLLVYKNSVMGNAKKNTVDA